MFKTVLNAVCTIKPQNIVTTYKGQQKRKVYISVTVLVPYIGVVEYMSSHNKIDPDDEFSKLEQLAFNGQWDKQEQERIWNAFGFSNLPATDVALDNNHARLGSLTTIFTLFDTYKVEKKFEPQLFGMIQRYTDKYPSCRQYVPDKILSAIYPTTMHGESDWKKDKVR